MWVAKWLGWGNAVAPVLSSVVIESHGRDPLNSTGWRTFERGLGWLFPPRSQPFRRHRRCLTWLAEWNTRRLKQNRIPFCGPNSILSIGPSSAGPPPLRGQSRKRGGGGGHDCAPHHHTQKKVSGSPAIHPLPQARPEDRPTAAEVAATLRALQRLPDYAI